MVLKAYSVSYMAFNLFWTRDAFKNLKKSFKIEYMYIHRTFYI